MRFQCDEGLRPNPLIKSLLVGCLWGSAEVRRELTSARAATILSAFVCCFPRRGCQLGCQIHTAVQGSADSCATRIQPAAAAKCCRRAALHGRENLVSGASFAGWSDVHVSTRTELTVQVIAVEADRGGSLHVGPVVLNAMGAAASLLKAMVRATTRGTSPCSKFGLLRSIRTSSVSYAMNSSPPAGPRPCSISLLRHAATCSTLEAGASEARNSSSVDQPSTSAGLARQDGPGCGLSHELSWLAERRGRNKRPNPVAIG